MLVEVDEPARALVVEIVVRVGERPGQLVGADADHDRRRGLGARRRPQVGADRVQAVGLGFNQSHGRRIVRYNKRVFGYSRLSGVV